MHIIGRQQFHLLCAVQNSYIFEHMKYDSISAVSFQKQMTVLTNYVKKRVFQLHAEKIVLLVGIGMAYDMSSVFIFATFVSNISLDLTYILLVFSTIIE